MLSADGVDGQEFLGTSWKYLRCCNSSFLPKVLSLVLQAEQSQLSQPLLMGGVLQSFGHLSGPPLNSFQGPQHLFVFPHCSSNNKEMIKQTTHLY